MASIRKEILISAPPGAVWDAVRDVGALHTRLVPGFVVDTVLEPGARIVTFADGRVLRELIVDCDDAARRLVWAAQSDLLIHHNGALQVLDASGGRSQAIWTADILPDTARETIAALMEQGLVTMRRTLETPAKLG